MEEPQAPKRDRRVTDESVSPIDREIRARIRAAVRQVWSRYAPARQNVLFKARIYRTATNKDGTLAKRPNIFYVCADCKQESKASDIQVDHIDPVGQTPKFPPDIDSAEWSSWIMKVFCPESNLQILCNTCHRRKSKAERQIKSTKTKGGRRVPKIRRHRPAP